MRRKRRAAAPPPADEDSLPAAEEQGSPAPAGPGDAGGQDPRPAGEIAAEAAEAVVWNYRGHDPEIALAGLAELLEKKGQGDSDLAEVVAELRAILKRRLPPGRPVS